MMRDLPEHQPRSGDIFVETASCPTIPRARRRRARGVGRQPEANPRQARRKDAMHCVSTMRGAHPHFSISESQITSAVF